MVVFIQSLLVLVINKPLKFQVTPKSVDRSVYEKERSALRLHFALLGAMIGALLFGSFRLLVWGAAGLSREAFWIVLFWGLYNASVIYMGVREVLSRRHERRHYRFPVNLSGYLATGEQTFPVQIENLSLSGAGLRAPISLQANTRLTGGWLTFSTPYHPRIRVPLKSIVFRRADAKGWLDGGAAFDELELAERDRLLEYLFVYRPGEIFANMLLQSAPQAVSGVSLQNMAASSQEAP